MWMFLFQTLPVGVKTIFVFVAKNKEFNYIEVMITVANQLVDWGNDMSTSKLNQAIENMVLIGSKSDDRSAGAPNYNAQLSYRQMSCNQRVRCWRNNIF